MNLAYAVVTVAVVSSMPAQQLLQAIRGAYSFEAANSVCAFGDYDGDGADDMLAFVPELNVRAHLRIFSVQSGVELWPGTTGVRIPGANVQYAGDLDQDGNPDVLVNGGVYTGYLNTSYYYVQAWSPSRNTMLWSRTGPWEAYGGYYGHGVGIAANLDVNADGRPDAVILSDGQAMPNRPVVSDVFVHDHAGMLLYHIPVLALGWRATAVGAMPDLDGDGCDEFLVGAFQPGIRGAVFVISGRTGSIHHFTPDLRQGDVIGGTVCDAGDVDGDGVHDYATASYRYSALTQLAIFSGATGALIRNWTDYWCQEGGMVGNVDIDLDGIPDLVVANPGIQIDRRNFGQFRAYSGRDGSVLWNHNIGLEGRDLIANRLVNLGVQPGSPYPVLGWSDYNWSGTGHGLIGTLDTRLLGQGPVTGTPVSSSLNLPAIGVRQVQGNARITVANGNPGSLAWLVGGLASESTYAGLPLPIALDPFGWTGCSAFVAPAVAIPTVLGTSGLDLGYAQIDLPFPIASTNGHALAAQWLLLDPTTGAFAVTQRHDFRIR
ncbi:MAG: hypothetical protein ABL997_16695 [Planctomycetota bacterium]